jgi:hypothetical protein
MRASFQISRSSPASSFLASATARRSDAHSRTLGCPAMYLPFLRVKTRYSGTCSPLKLTVRLFCDVSESIKKPRSLAGAFKVGNKVGQTREQNRPVVTTPRQVKPGCGQPVARVGNLVRLSFVVDREKGPQVAFLEADSRATRREYVLHPDMEIIILMTEKSKGNGASERGYGPGGLRAS